MLANQRKIKELAIVQHGYFTACQAKQCGFNYDLHTYHCHAGNWLKVDRGLFRFPGFADTLESRFTFWMLWSRNKSEQPQGIISHESALALRGLGDHDPENVHLTVPTTFTKKPQAGCRLHKATLNLSAIESRTGFLVTRLPRTLADLRSFLEARNLWRPTVEQALASGLLDREELPELGFDLPLVSPGIEPALAGAKADREPRSVDGGLGISPEAGPEPPHLFSPPVPTNPAPNPEADSTLRRERIYQMIFQRTPAKPLSRRQAQAGFTLVELLVVMAIISLLASLLLTALGRSLDLAQETWCMNNLRQTGVYLTIYADDTRGYFPKAFASSFDKWIEYTVTCFKSDGLNYKLFACPADKKERTLAGEKRTYAANYYSTEASTPKRIQPATPANFFLVGERVYSAGVIGHSGCYDMYWSADTTPLHQQQTHGLFLCEDNRVYRDILNTTIQFWGSDYWQTHFRGTK